MTSTGGSQKNISYIDDRGNDEQPCWLSKEKSPSMSLKAYFNKIVDILANRAELAGESTENTDAVSGAWRSEQKTNGESCVFT